MLTVKKSCALLKFSLLEKSCPAMDFKCDGTGLSLAVSSDVLQQLLRQ